MDKMKFLLVWGVGITETKKTRKVDVGLSPFPVILLMEEILRQLIGSLSHYYPLLTMFCKSQVVQDF